MTPDQIATKGDIERIVDRMERLEAMISGLASPRWVPISDYAAEKGVTVRTAHEWRKAGQIETRGTARKCEVKVW